jgi:hypothetical protein
MFATRKLLAVDEVRFIGQNIVKCPLAAGWERRTALL